MRIDHISRSAFAEENADRLSLEFVERFDGRLDSSNQPSYSSLTPTITPGLGERA